MASRTSEDLSGQWQLRDEDGEYELPMQVPGDAITALVEAGRLEHPYIGSNELQARWVAEREWVLSTKFSIDSLVAEGPANATWVLELSSLDTIATVSLNNRTIIEADNSFLRYRVDVSPYLQSGSNQLSIVFHSNVKEAAKRQAAQPFFIPFAADNTPVPNVNMLRKVQCDFGWDWNIALAPFGLYEAPTLWCYEHCRIESVVVHQWHMDNNTIHATVVIDAIVSASGTLPLDITIANQSLAEQVTVTDGTNTLTFSLALENIPLWWPNGLGDQTLHTVSVTLGDAHYTSKIGFRQAQLVTGTALNNSVDDGAFFLQINGQAVFCRGANWIPADALASGISDEKTTALLQSAVDANMNMLRVWGGGRYESDFFYSECDRLGILVWQDFMFSCSLYPSTPEFLQQVEAEVSYQVKRLADHASVVLWCGDNELIGALTWFAESVNDRDRYLVNYDRLNRCIETALFQVLPEANWWPSSPSPGYLKFGDAWHDDSSGDMHFWSVWHEGQDFDHYRTVTPRFCSEFGFQSFPSMALIRTFAQEAHWNISSPTMEAHQKNAGGNARILETMTRYFRLPSDFASLVYLSQIQQGLAIRTAVEAWRAQKPRCMGTLYWQLNDTWPVASWSSLEYGGQWKALHYMARRFYQPVLVTTRVDKDTDRLFFVASNDTTSTTKIDISVYQVNLQGVPSPLDSFSTCCDCEASQMLGSIAISDLHPDCVLMYEWSSNDQACGQEHWLDTPYKSLDLLPAKLQLSCTATEQKGVPTDAIELTVTSSNLSLFATLNASVQGRFSDNILDILPAKPRKILFFPARSLSSSGLSPMKLLEPQSENHDEAENIRFTITDLQGSYATRL